MHVKDHQTLETLKRLERTEKNADRARRLRIVVLAIEGWPGLFMSSGVKGPPGASKKLEHNHFH